MNDLYTHLNLENVEVQSIQLGHYAIDVLRLDKIDPLISGNKWFKLKYYLQAFRDSDKAQMATFGGAYSNHIAATAKTGKLLGITTLGCIRGEEPNVYSPTLEQAKQNGMKLHFVSREAYKEKEQIEESLSEYFWISEGGYGAMGARGVQDIWELVPERAEYQNIFLAMGTGTTVAGVLNGALPHQKVFAVNILKNNISIYYEIESMVVAGKMDCLEILNGYHFGGYAKKTTDLLNFMQQIYSNYQLPLDFVYTAKAFYALYDFCQKGLLAKGTRTLFIHTGGLQGNNSLDKSVLGF